MLPLREVRLGGGGLRIEHRADHIRLSCAEPLGPYPRSLTERLDHWAAAAPDRLFLAKRDGSGRWQGVSYRGAAALIRRLGQALLDRKLSAERPVMILSGNDVEHGLLMLA